MSQLDAIVREFVAETYENLAQLEVDLVGLEREPGSRDLVASIFRTIHTVKGTCGFLGLPRLEELAHAGENLLSRWRDGALDSDSTEPVDLLLRMVDVLRTLLASIEATGSDDVEAETVASVVSDIDEFLVRSAQGEPGVPAAVPTDVPAAAAAPQAREDVAPAGEPDDSAENVPAPTAPAGALRTDDSVRVGTDVLDALVRQVGELVLARNRLARLAADRRDPELLAATAAVRSVVGELQASVMKTRMQPVSHAWQGLPRLVRDLSAQLGKPLELDTSGGDVELDRALIDTLRDPLTHLVRNAADHGIETASERRAAGKPGVGRITLRAHRQGGTLVIEVADDGRGVDLARVRERAVASGLLSADSAAACSDDELAELVFQPGFSTAAAVSHVSGRGVGMDVVRSAVQSVRGTVRLSSAPGEGTTCRLALPVTLAVTPSVTVEVAGQRFAIPHSDLRELVLVDGTGTAIEDISGAPVLRLREQLVPVVVLGAELGLRPADERRVGTVAVLAVRDRAVGLLVDSVLDTEEVLVEPLDPRVRHLSAYVGAAIMADGRVSLVLNLHALVAGAMAAGETLDLSDAGSSTESPSSPLAAAVGASTAQCLVALVSGGRRIALAMDQMARLETFDASRVEHLGGREVVQYRGNVVPVLRLGRYLERRSGDDPTPTTLSRSVPAVVYTRGGRTVALAVEEIVDIVPAAELVELESQDPRISGGMVLQDLVTELVEVDAALAAADPAFFDALETVGASGTSSQDEVA